MLLARCEFIATDSYPGYAANVWRAKIFNLPRTHWMTATIKTRYPAWIRSDGNHH
jgi:hypothetical protein